MAEEKKKEPVRLKLAADATGTGKGEKLVAATGSRNVSGEKLKLARENEKKGQ